MPSSHRLAIRKLLDHVTERISNDEAKLLSATDGEREKLIEQLADLHIRQQELMDALTGDLS